MQNIRKCGYTYIVVFLMIISSEVPNFGTIMILYTACI
jgi:hypothetical protein